MIELTHTIFFFLVGGVREGGGDEECAPGRINANL